MCLVLMVLEVILVFLEVVLLVVLVVEVEANFSKLQTARCSSPGKLPPPR